MQGGRGAERAGTWRDERGWRWCSAQQRCGTRPRCWHRCGARSQGCHTRSSRSREAHDACACACACARARERARAFQTSERSRRSCFTPTHTRRDARPLPSPSALPEGGLVSLNLVRSGSQATAPPRAGVTGPSLLRSAIISCASCKPPRCDGSRRADGLTHASE
jgi:hypothetical protein